MDNINKLIEIIGYKPETIGIGKYKTRPFCSFKNEDNTSYIQILNNLKELRSFMSGCDKTIQIKVISEKIKGISEQIKWNLLI